MQSLSSKEKTFRKKQFLAVRRTKNYWIEAEHYIYNFRLIDVRVKYK